MLDIQNNEACFEDPFTQIENCLLGIVSYDYIDTYYYYELVSTDLDDCPMYNEIQTLYTLDDLTATELVIHKHLTDTFFNSDNGITAWLETDTIVDCSFTTDDLDNFIKKYDLYDNIFVDEEGYGITISYLTRFEKIE